MSWETNAECVLKAPSAVKVFILIGTLIEWRADVAQEARGDAPREAGGSALGADEGDGPDPPTGGAAMRGTGGRGGED